MANLKNWDDNPQAKSFHKYSTLIQDFGRNYGYFEITFISKMNVNTEYDVILVQVEGHGKRYLMLKLGNIKNVKSLKANLEYAVRHFNINHLEIIESESHFCYPIQMLDGMNFVEFYQRSEDIPRVLGTIDRIFHEKMIIFNNTSRLRGQSLNKEFEYRNVFQMYSFNQPVIIQNLKEINSEKEGIALLDWWNEQSVISKRNSYVRINNGNLHGENIALLDGSIELLDYSETCEGHVFMDFTKLECDIYFKILPQDPNFVRSDYLLMEEALYKSSDIDDLNIPRIVKALKVIKKIREVARNFAINTLRMSAEEFEYDYSVALFVQNLIFAASDYYDAGILPVEIQRKIKEQAIENAHLLQENIVELTYDSILWKVAYTFLRLDQLPVGGWSRSLPSWLWAVQLAMNKFPHPGAFEDLRIKGGVNITCEAYLQYLHFVFKSLNFHLYVESDHDKVHTINRNLFKLETINKVSERTKEYLQKRIGIGGGVDVIGQGELSDLKNQIHHTLLTTIVLMYYEIPIRIIKTSPLKDLEDTLEFLLGYLKDFGRQKTERLFGTYAVAELLKHMIESNIFSIPDSFDKSIFLNELNKTIKGIINSVGDQIGITNIYFHPDLHLQRSDFLMQLAFLLIDNDVNLLSKDNNIKKRIIRCLEEMVSEISDSNADHGLLKFVKNGDVGDFGNSAKLATYLRSPLIHNLLNHSGSEYSKNKLIHKSSIIKKALIKSLIDFNDDPKNFYYTHGVSFSYYLNLINYTPQFPEIEGLDKSIELFVGNTVTEFGIVELLKEIFSGEFHFPSKIEELADKLNVEKNKLEIFRLFVSVKNLLLSKLESGAYAHGKEWDNMRENARKSTLNFFNSELGVKNARANSNNKQFREFLYKRLDLYLENMPLKSNILDIGCGNGDYAAYFLNKGMNVQLIDNSEKMIALAQENIESNSKYKQYYCAYAIEEIDLIDFADKDRCSDLVKKLKIAQKYNMIFADGVIFHVPKEKIEPIFKNLHQMLDENGILFVNFKINDHTLVSFDGRFFEYYPDYSNPLYMLNMNGFVLDELIITQKSTTMYGKPLFTQWAHYFCTKAKKPQTA